MFFDSSEQLVGLTLGGQDCGALEREAAHRKNGQARPSCFDPGSCLTFNRFAELQSCPLAQICPKT